MSEQIKLGFAGGRFGKNQIEAFRHLPEITLVAIAEPDETLRQELVDTYSIPSQYDDCSEMILNAQLDAVVISSPSYLHEKHACQALDAGLHVLCEKPPAINAREMSHILTTAGLVGKTYMFARQQRFFPEILEARNLVADGQAGDILHAETRWIWTWQSFPKNSWRANNEKGGGVLLDVGIHIIDSAWFAMGCPDPVEAMASHFNLHMKNCVDDPDEAAEDTSSGMIRFKNGATLHFSSTYFSHFPAQAESEYGAPHKLELKLHGAKAALDLVKAEKSTVTSREPKTENYAQPADSADAFRKQAQEFISAIREDREPQNSGKQALTLMKMLDALKESAKEKRAVSIKAKRDLDDLFNSL